MTTMRLLDLLSDPRTPLVLACVAALARVVYALISRVVQPYPRARAIVEAVAALLPDVLRAGLQIVAAATGRPAPRLDAPIGGDPNARAEQALQNAVTLSASSDGWRRRALAAEERVAELTAADGGGVRPTVVPGDVPERSPDETTVSGRRRLPPGTLGTMCLALALAGCPQVIREPAVTAPPRKGGE